MDKSNPCPTLAKTTHDSIAFGGRQCIFISSY